MAAPMPVVARSGYVAQPQMLGARPRRPRDAQDRSVYVAAKAAILAVDAPRNAIGRPRLLFPHRRAHPRARVAAEERHRYLPTWAIRGIYRALIRPWAWAYRRGSRP